MILPGPLANTGAGLPRRPAAVARRRVPPLVVDSRGRMVVLGEVESAETPTTVLEPYEQQSSRTREMYGTSVFGKRLCAVMPACRAGVVRHRQPVQTSSTARKTLRCPRRSASAPATVYDYRDTLGPQLDRALGGLMDDLQSSGLFGETLVVSAPGSSGGPRESMPTPAEIIGLTPGPASSWEPVRRGAR